MSQTPSAVTTQGCYLVITVAFLGWRCAGMQMGTLPIASLSISQDLMGADFNPAIAAKWFGKFTAVRSVLPTAQFNFARAAGWTPALLNRNHAVET